MESKSKYIGINMRLPYAVLEDTLSTYFETGEVDRQALTEYLKAYTKGENRVKKVVGQVARVFTTNKELLDRIKIAFPKAQQPTLSATDRKTILFCLVCLTYPIIYDLVLIMASAFKVEPQLKKEYLLLKMGALYGGNRSMHIAVTQAMPLLLEFEIIARAKTSLYQKDKRIVCNEPMLAEMVIYSDIKLSGSRSILRDEISHRPWYAYFDLGSIELQFRELLTLKESLVGHGYITIKA